MSEFNGDKKIGKPLLHKIEQKLVTKFVSKIHPKIETYHLTLSTIIWCLIIIIASHFAKFNIQWLWLVSIAIIMQYLTDLFDGAVGRYRNTGLIKWGYYMDHFLDYIFLCSILIGYSFILPNQFDYMLFFILAIFGAYMVNAFLAFATTNQFKITFLKIGPTEIRILFIIINTLIILFGKTHIAPVLPYVLAISFIGLCIVVYKTQKEIWKIDIINKNQNENKN